MLRGNQLRRFLVRLLVVFVAAHHYGWVMAAEQDTADPGELNLDQYSDDGAQIYQEGKGIVDSATWEDGGQTITYSNQEGEQQSCQGGDCGALPETPGSEDINQRLESVENGGVKDAEGFGRQERRALSGEGNAEGASSTESGAGAVMSDQEKATIDADDPVFEPTKEMIQGGGGIEQAFSDCALTIENADGELVMVRVGDQETDCQLACQDGDCVETDNEENSSFGTVAQDLQTIDSIAKHMGCARNADGTIDVQSCRVFKGERLAVDHWQYSNAPTAQIHNTLVNFGQASCFDKFDSSEASDDVSLQEYLQMTRATWSGVKATGVPQATATWATNTEVYKASSEYVKEGYQAVKEPVVNGWDSIAKQLGADQAQNQATQQATESGISTAVSSAKQAMFDQIGTWTQETFGRQAATTLFETTQTAGGTTTYVGLSSAVTSAISVIGWVYTAYKVLDALGSMTTNCQRWGSGYGSIMDTVNTQIKTWWKVGGSAAYTVGGDPKVKICTGGFQCDDYKADHPGDGEKYNMGLGSMRGLALKACTPVGGHTGGYEYVNGKAVKKGPTRCSYELDTGFDVEISVGPLEYDKWISVDKTCLRETYYFCCFNSPLARIMQEQVRSHIGGKPADFGSPDNPDCQGLTISELSGLSDSDWEEVDLSEWTQILRNNGQLPQGDDMSVDSMSDLTSVLQGG